MLRGLQNSLGNVLRSAGQSLDSIGRRFEIHPYVERLQPSTQVVKLGKDLPQVNGAFIAPSATVIGKVTIGQSSCVWYGAVLRGDDSSITVGQSVTIGDRVMIHASGGDVDLPTVIGDRSVIGSGAILHGCILADECVIGSGAQVMDGAKVQKHAIVAPGSLVPQGKTVPSGQLWAGMPAKYARDLYPAEIAAIASKALAEVEISAVHALENAKTWETIEAEDENRSETAFRSLYYYQKLTPEQISFKLGEVDKHNAPGRVFDSDVSARKAPECRPEQ